MERSKREKGPGLRLGPRLQAGMRRGRSETSELSPSSLSLESDYTSPSNSESSGSLSSFSTFGSRSTFASSSDSLSSPDLCGSFAFVSPLASNGQGASSWSDERSSLSSPLKLPPRPQLKTSSRQNSHEASVTVPVPVRKQGCTNQAWRQLVGFLPASLDCEYSVECNESGQFEPRAQEMEACCMFVDISNYSSVSSELSAIDTDRGAERVALFLNSCFSQVVRLVSKAGGDVIRYAGDGIIVLWPVPNEETQLVVDACCPSLKIAVRRAVQCALDIQDTLPSINLFEDRRWSFKIGIGAGKASLLHLGGTRQYRRREYLAVGDALLQAFEAEHRAEAQRGQVICSPEAMFLASDFFEWQPVKGAYYSDAELAHKTGVTQKSNPAGAENARLLPFSRIKGQRDGASIRKKRNKAGANPLNPAAQNVRLNQGMDATQLYLPAEVQEYYARQDDASRDWLSELRHSTVLFMHLGFGSHEACCGSHGGRQDNDSKGFLEMEREQQQTSRYERQGRKRLERLHAALVLVQRAVYDYQGVVNKINFDDKGVTVIAAFGLGSQVHKDDAARGVLAALRTVSMLKRKLGLGASVGITSGVCFCGVVGHCGGRKEYTLVGDPVNMAARLMQCAKSSFAARVITDERTQSLVRGAVEFSPEELKIQVKGKMSLMRVYSPALVGASRGSNPYSFSTSLSAPPSQLQRWSSAAISAALSGCRSGSTADWGRDWEEQVARYGPRAVQSFKELRIDMIHTDVVQGSGPEQSLSRGKLGHSSLLNVIIGETGIGKSHALALVWQNQVQSQSRGSALFAAIGNPFRTGDMARPCGVWVDIVEQCISEEFCEDEEETVEHLGENDPRQGLLALWLDLAKSQSCDHAYLLDPLFQVNFGRNGGHRRLKQRTRSCGSSSSLGDSCNSPELSDNEVWVRACLVADLVRGYAISRREEFGDPQARTVCIIDDAHHMDHQSWTVLECLVTEAHEKSNKSGVMEFLVSVVLATEPWTNNSEEWVAHAEAIAQHSSGFSRVEALQPLSYGELAILVRSSLDVVSVPKDLVDIVAITSLGNPLFALELLEEMRSMGLLSINSNTASCTWSPGDKVATYLTFLRKKDDASVQTSFSKMSLHQSFSGFLPQSERTNKSSGLRQKTDGGEEAKCGAQIKLENALFPNPKGSRSLFKESGAHPDKFMGLFRQVRHVLEKLMSDKYERFKRHEMVSMSFRLRSRLERASSVTTGLAHGFNNSGARLFSALAIRPPPSLSCILGAWLCELTVQQLLVLQVASLALKETTVDASTLAGVDSEQRSARRPSKAGVVDLMLVFRKAPVLGALVRMNSTLSEAKVDSELKQLEFKGFVRRVVQDGPTGDPGDTAIASTSANCTFAFTHQLLPHLLQLRMLQIQKHEINRCLSGATETHEQFVRRQFLARAHGVVDYQSVTIKQGMVLVQKNKETKEAMGARRGRLARRRHSLGAMWKRRYACLYSDRIDFYADAAQTKLKGSTYLKGAKVALEDQGMLQRCSVLRINAQRWEKHSELEPQGNVNLPRAFYISPVDQAREELEDWQYKINFAIECDGFGSPIEYCGSSPRRRNSIHVEIGSPRSGSKKVQQRRSGSCDLPSAPLLGSRRDNFGGKETANDYEYYRDDNEDDDDDIL